MRREREREINIRHHMGKFTDKHNKCSRSKFVFDRATYEDKQRISIAKTIRK